jgi:hypothetical protein
MTIPLDGRERHPHAPSRMVGAVLVHVAGPLACGALLYAGFRPIAIRLFHWLAWAGFVDLAAICRTALAPARAALPHWVVYSLPDGLWCYAATAAALALWRDAKVSLFTRVLPHAGFVCACGLELLQSSGVMAGTADPVDVLVSWVGYVSALLTFSRCCHEKAACVSVDR